MKEFRPYQVDSLGASLRVVESGGKRALVVMATGLGKSVIAARLARTMWNIFGWRTLFVMHMVDPLRKISSDHFREEFEGTAATFGMFTGDEKSNVDNCDVLFSTFQTMLPNLSFFAPDAFQLIVVDEAHHIWAETFKQVVDYFTPDFLFGMTATPDRMDGKNIREVFGDEVYNYPLAEALAHGEWLADVDYRVVADDVDKAALAELLTRIHSNRGVRFTQGEIDKAVFLAEKLDVQARLIREVQEGGDLKTIVFCRDTKHLKLMHKLLPDYLPFHSKIAKKTLGERFAAFEKGTIRKLLVIDKFNESIDVPDAELIVFLRATESRTIWLQQLGRGLRRPNGKKTVTVLDFVANCDRIFNIHEFTKAVRNWEPPPTRDAQTIRTGWRVTLTQEVRDIFEVLKFKRNDDNLYATWEEASAAVQRLSPRPYGRVAYHSVYKQDPRLPSRPAITYSSMWKKNGSWPGFLGTNRSTRKSRDSFYTTWEEASLAAQRLSPRPDCRKAYTKVYKQDRRLPASPHSFYSNVFEKNGGWPGFLGVKRSNRRSSTTVYTTWIEASAAVQRLSPKPGGKETYMAVYRRDPRLPSCPNRTYASVWKQNGGWAGFLGTLPYTTWGEASVATQRLNPRPMSGPEYRQCYNQDPRLPSSPERIYATVWKKNGSWPGFLGKI